MNLLKKNKNKVTFDLQRFIAISQTTKDIPCHMKFAKEKHVVPLDIKSINLS